MTRKVFIITGYGEGGRPTKEEGVITSFLERNGFEVITGRKSRSGRDLNKEIIRLIKDCAFIVVIVNNNQKWNIPYEFGIARGFADSTGDEAKEIILIVEKSIGYPWIERYFSDVKGSMWSTVDASGSEGDIWNDLMNDQAFMEAIIYCVSLSLGGGPDAERAAEGLVRSNVPLGMTDPDEQRKWKKEIAADEAARIITALERVPGEMETKQYYAGYLHWEM